MMHFGEKFTDDEVEEMISEADANNDGQIDYTEFSQMILREIDTSTRRNSTSNSETAKSVEETPNKKTSTASRGDLFKSSCTQ